MPQSKDRSLVASQSGIAEIKHALTRKKWTYEALVNKAELGRATVANFCTGRAIDRKNFVICCEALELNWELIADQPTADIDSLVQQLRASSAENLRKRCGTMRILDMTQPIDTGAIYTDVNILERVAGKSRAKVSQLMQQCGTKEFDRFSLGNKQGTRSRWVA
jgi:hypothetical protein